MMEHGITHIDGGFRCAICKPGRKFNHVVFLDGPNIRVKKVRANQPVKFSPIGGTKQHRFSLPYLAKRMLRQRTALGTKKHITKGARRILEEAAQT